MKFGTIGLPSLMPATVTAIILGFAFMAFAAAVIAGDGVSSVKVMTRMSDPQYPSQVETLSSGKVASSCALTASQTAAISDSKRVPQLTL